MLAAFLDGRLTAAERAQIEAHLADCSECRELLADATRSVTELEAAPQQASAGAAPISRWPWVLAALAAAAAIVLVVGLRSGRLAMLFGSPVGMRPELR